MPHLHRFFWLVAPVAAVLVGFGGCGSADPLLLCGQIPAGGCPIGRGGTCGDPTCAAVYDCVQGSWTVTSACPANSGGSGGGSVDGGDGGQSDARCTPVNITVDAGEAAGCTPDLELPDCPIAAAECAENACETGCTDFYVCEAAGYTAVAHCDDAGHFIVGN